MREETNSLQNAIEAGLKLALNTESFKYVPEIASIVKDRVNDFLNQQLTVTSLKAQKAQNTECKEIIDDLVSRIRKEIR